MRKFPRIQEEILFSKASGNWSTSNSFSSRTVCKQSACLHNVWWIPLICIGMKFTRSVERSAASHWLARCCLLSRQLYTCIQCKGSVCGLNCAFICCVYIWCVYAVRFVYIGESLLTGLGKSSSVYVLGVIYIRNGSVSLLSWLQCSTCTSTCTAILHVCRWSMRFP